jgi:hypothetical protein
MVERKVIVSTFNATKLVSLKMVNITVVPNWKTFIKGINSPGWDAVTIFVSKIGSSKRRGWTK